MERSKISRDEAKQRILRDISCTDFLEKAPHGGYICPFCGSGTGAHGTGAVKFYPKTNTCACHACPEPGQKARRFDVLDLIQQHFGYDYNAALEYGADRLGFDIAKREYTVDIGGAFKDVQTAPEAPQNTPESAGDKKPVEEPKAQQAANSGDIAGTADYREYYKQCVQRITDPAAASYLQARGISIDNALGNYVGYDPAADPASAPGAIGNEYRPHPCPRIIIPTSKGHYVARSINPATEPGYQKMNPNRKMGASEPGIFNEKALYKSDVQEVFVVEGAFDALSIMECGAAAIALNSTSNAALLLEKLKQKPTQATLIICMDNDDSGKKASYALFEGMLNLGNNNFTMEKDICCGYKDANEALVKDRAGFFNAVKKALDDVRSERGKNESIIADIKQEISSLSAEQMLDSENPIYDKIYSQDDFCITELEVQLAERAGILGIHRQVKEIAVKHKADQRQKKKEASLPGLLTFENTVNIFQNADDRILEMKSFPEFSKTAKIHVHDTVALAAETGGGKSSLALNFLYDLNENYPCLYINLEMDILEILRRLVSISSGMELDRIAGYKKDETTAGSVNTTLQKITARKPLQVADNVYKIEDIEKTISQTTAGRKEPTIVIIDHSLLVKTEEWTAGRYDRFTKISEGLREMARRYNVIIFVLLQQNRAGKADEEERPKNSSLKESGSWENDATCICFLWYDPTDKRKKLIITKNRHGECGEFALNYWRKTQKYSEAKDQESATRSEPAAAKTSKREKQRQKLMAAWEKANIETFGNPTLRALAEAADVTTSTIKGWIKEYGGCTINGEMVDPAGIDTEVEYTGFVRLTPADEETPFTEPVEEKKIKPGY